MWVAPKTRDSLGLWRWARQFPKGLGVLLAAEATVGGAGSQKTSSSTSATGIALTAPSVMGFWRWLFVGAGRGVGRVGAARGPAAGSRRVRPSWTH